MTRRQLRIRTVARAVTYTAIAVATAAALWFGGSLMILFGRWMGY